MLVAKSRCVRAYIAHACASPHKNSYTHIHFAHTLLVRSLVAAVPCGMDTAWPRSCWSRAYASNKDCDCAVPALLSAASQLEVHSGKWDCSMAAETGLEWGARPAVKMDKGSDGQRE
eukprot:1157540-Pelagomonas_calceolata.AAC.10